MGAGGATTVGRCPDTCFRGMSWWDMIGGGGVGQTERRKGRGRQAGSQAWRSEGFCPTGSVDPQCSPAHAEQLSPQSDSATAPCRQQDTLLVQHAGLGEQPCILGWAHPLGPSVPQKAVEDSTHIFMTVPALHEHCHPCIRAVSMEVSKEGSVLLSSQEEWAQGTWGFL